MKNRKGFVSNSSSSSFITIGEGRLDIPTWDMSTLNVPEDFGGGTEFGWGPAEYSDFGSRLNFTFMQTHYGKGESDALLDKALEAVEGHSNPWLGMLETVLKDRLGVETINWNLDMDGYDCYIDHQSNAGDGENTEMFASFDSLEKFLFAEDSSITEDNDNH